MGKKMRYLKYFETPDNIVYNLDSINYTDKFAHPFGYIDGKFLIGSGGETHGELYFDRDEFDYPGRIFTKQKVITFWIFPNKEKFREIVNELSQKTGIDIWNDEDWRVEILFNNNTNSYVTKNSKGYEYDPFTKSEVQVKYIPIKEYTTSVERTNSELRKKHGEYQRPADIGYTPKIKKWKDWMIPGRE